MSRNWVENGSSIAGSSGAVEKDVSTCQEELRGTYVPAKMNSKRQAPAKINLKMK
jgi:hypothetical protein